MGFVNDNSRLFLAPATSHDVECHGELCEGMGLTYPAFQVGAEDLHVGDDMSGRLCTTVSYTSFKFPSLNHHVSLSQLLTAVI